MKNIGLMTCFLDNCGACLQAYALQNTLISQMDGNVEIVQYVEPSGYFSNDFFQLVKEWKAVAFVRGLFSKRYRETYRLEKIRRASFRKFRKKYLKLSAERYQTYEQLKNARLPYDCYVCGSDQIWNPSFYGACNPAYYLDFVSTGAKTIAYAPSIGISDLEEKDREDFQRCVRKIDYVSVREKQAVELCKKYADIDAKWVVDPTLLYDGDAWNQIAAKRQHKKPYIFCYLFGKNPAYVKAISHLANQSGFDVVNIPFSKRDLGSDFHSVYQAGPREFLALIRDAEYVLTDSFHASVFSVLFQKNFFTLLRHQATEVKGMNSRIYNLLELLGLEDRCITESEYESFAITPVQDYSAVNQRLKSARDESLKFLQNALRGE